MGNTLSSASISTLRMMAVLSTENVRESACARVTEAAKNDKALGVLEIDGSAKESKGNGVVDVEHFGAGCMGQRP